MAVPADDDGVEQDEEVVDDNVFISDEADEEVANSDEDEIFRFFDLPREMRGRIYAEATDDVWVKLEEQPSCYGIHTQCAILESAPILDMKLVSRQFGHEYEEEMAMKSPRAGLMIALDGADYLLRRMNTSLEAAMSRVGSLELTHRLPQLFDVDFILQENLDVGLAKLERLVHFLPGLKHLKLVFIDSLEEFVSPMLEDYYCPTDFEPTKIHRLLCDKLSHPLFHSIAISCSVALSGKLFKAKRGSGMFFMLVEDHYLNHILYHAPSSLNPIGLDVRLLEFDESESSTFRDLMKCYQQRRQKGVGESEHPSRFKTAGYRMVHEL
ncbi:hypothetical protein PRZ48_009918 [Zasmidium cellare]|uniref:Uncharacterized protein n=1 Tax=Zasmidium cellare TaxID=395010 RepID=A0ABR0ED25_ZASCE|nr:hypothetical protein PRZ48_009918 [Zasmidium cellare]